MRPITVMSVIYRLWASTRMEELGEWQKAWISEDVTGYRSVMGCEDVWYCEALDVEEALLSGVPLCGLTLDFARAFDNLPQEVLLTAAERMGMPQPVLLALRGMYAGLERHFRLGPLVGKGFKSTNGILQGCPLSVLLLNIFAEIWTRAVKSRVPACKPRSYADDVGTTAPDAATLEAVLKVTEELDDATGMSVKASKSAAWATTATLRKDISNLTIHGEALPVSGEERRLGAQLSYSRKRSKAVLSRKLGECERICLRVGGLLAPFGLRAALVGALVMTKATYSCAASPPSKRDSQRLRVACSRAIWGQANRWRSNHVLHSLLTAGHKTDPQQACAYNTLVTIRRILRRRPECSLQLQRIMQMRREQNASNLPGPGLALHHALRRMGATMEWLHYGPALQFSSPQVARDMNNEINLLTDCKGLLLHTLRDALRSQQWSALHRAREGYDGVQHGVLRKPTMALECRLSGLAKYRWRCVMAGAVPTGNRLFRMGWAESAECQLCGTGAKETWRHLVDDCPAVDGVRYRELRPVAWHTLPDCLRLRGIVPESLLPAPDWANQGWQEEVAAIVQYTLLGLMEAREAAMPHLAPQPRW